MQIRLGKLMDFRLTRSVNVDPTLRLQNVISKHLLNFDSFIDIGANKGEFTDFLLSEIQKLDPTPTKSKRFILIEPHAVMYRHLKNKYKGKNIDIIKCALGSKNFNSDLHVANNNFASSSLLNFDLHKKIIPDIMMVGRQKTMVRKLSTIVDLSSSRSVFLKIDVQGYELEVLKGISKKDYRNITMLLVECNLVKTYRNCALLEEILIFMRQRGFKPFRIENGFGGKNFGQQLQVEVLFKK